MLCASDIVVARWQARDRKAPFYNAPRPRHISGFQHGAEPIHRPPSLIPYWGLWVNVLSRWTGPLGRWAICRGTRWPWRRLTLTNTCTTKPSDVEMSAGAREVFKGAASTSTLSTIASAAPKQTPARLWMFILIARLLCFPYSAPHSPDDRRWGAQSGSIWPFRQSRARLAVRNASCVSHFALGILKGAELFATKMQFSHGFRSNA